VLTQTAFFPSLFFIPPKRVSQRPVIRCESVILPRFNNYINSLSDIPLQKLKPDHRLAERMGISAAKGRRSAPSR